MSTNTYLDHLFVRLKTPNEFDEVSQIESEIWEEWVNTGTPHIDRMLRTAIGAMAESDYIKAIALLDKIISHMPSYAEAFNKRATAYYLRGEFKKSIEDIRTTLQFEPRHFGALSGLASIYLIVGKNNSAMQVLEKIREISPCHLGLAKQMKDLSELMGQ